MTTSSPRIHLPSASGPGRSVAGLDSTLACPKPLGSYSLTGKRVERAVRKPSALGLNRAGGKVELEC